MSPRKIELFKSLHQQAEERAGVDETAALQTLTLDDARLLFHELRVHQIELEMQNEELRRTQHELAASQARYFSLYDLAPVGYLTLNEQGLIKDVNLALAIMLGVARKKLLRKPLSAFMFSEDQDIYYLHRKRIFEVNELQVWEMRMVQADGRPFWARLQATPAHDGEYWITLVDITKRKLAEEALRKSEKQYHTILHTALDGFWIVDLRGHFIDVNDAYCTIIGYSRNELLDMTIPDVEVIENSAGIESRMQDIIDNGSIRFESRHRCKDGRIVDLDISVSYLSSDFKMCTFLRDITERKQSGRVLQARLRISDYAFAHSLAELMTKVLDEAETLTDSQIGFFHFVETDQVTLSLQTWSTHTLSTICKMEGSRLHYPLESAGVWADCIREKRPLIHNNYVALPDRKGLPPGHAPVQRELVVPVFRNNLIVAVLGVGNKKSDYTVEEMTTIQNLASLAWDIVTRKRAEEDLQESELRFRSLMDLTPNIAVQGYTLDGTTTYWNNASERLYGYTRDEALGKNMFDLIIPSEMQPEVRQDMDRMSETAEVIPPGELLLLRKDGSAVPVYSCHALLKPPGRDMELFCLDLDLTVLKQTEASLRATELKYSRLFESMNDAYGCVDMDGRLFESNAAFQRMTGYGPEELPFLTYVSLTPEKWHAFEEEIIKEQVLVRGYSDVYQKQYQRKDGRIIDVELKTFLMKDDQGKPVGMWAILRDISDRKRAEHELQHAKDAAEDANRAKSSFLATMSHEIRTPLSAMLGNVELLEGSQLTAQQHEYLDDCKSAAQMLLQVINDVLDFSKIEAGKLQLVNETFSVSMMSRQLVRIFSAAARQKGLDLTLSLSDELPEYIRGDQQRLRQIVSNLLGNAIKFTRHGTVSLEVVCEPNSHVTIPGQVLLRIVVRDTGIGIPYDKRDLIFDSFTQVENFSTRSSMGTGLGLPICRRLLTLMGGSITVSSVPGEGSVFTAVLPVTPAQCPVPVSVPVPAPDPISISSPTPATARRILFADDDQKGREVVMKLLQRSGYQVTAVENGTKLLDTLLQEEFDIVLTDISMPDMDGTQVARIIRSGERAGIDPHIPIIAMTAHAFCEDRELILEAGIDGYVSKPVNLEMLLAEIERLCMHG